VTKLTVVLFTALIGQRDWKFMLMRTLLVDDVQQTQTMLTTFYLKLALLFVMQTVQ
jgi:hypothetical protein